MSKKCWKNLVETRRPWSYDCDYLSKIPITSITQHFNNDQAKSRKQTPSLENLLAAAKTGTPTIDSTRNSRLGDVNFKFTAQFHQHCFLQCSAGVINTFHTMVAWFGKSQIEGEALMPCPTAPVFKTTSVPVLNLLPLFSIFIYITLRHPTVVEVKLSFLIPSNRAHHLLRLNAFIYRSALSAYSGRRVGRGEVCPL